MTEKSKLFGYVGRWILTALIQVGKMLSDTFSLAATGVGFLSATSQQHGMCYSSYYISNTLCSILVVINHWVNRGFPWNKSTHGYFASCYFGSQFLCDFATFSQIAVCMYTLIHRENDQHEIPPKNILIVWNCSRKAGTSPYFCVLGNSSLHSWTRDKARAL